MTSTIHCKIFIRVTLILCAFLIAPAVWPQVLTVPSNEMYTREKADGFWRTASGALNPVYAPLAEWIVQEFGLADKAGIGIDLGGGPGNLVVELAKRSPKMYWIDADINPHFFTYLFQLAEQAHVIGQVGAVFADAQSLPFRDEYADIITSRGSFQFWKDKTKAFSEIYRVLKPGGIAYIGRGFSKNLPLETATQIRNQQGKGRGMPKYSIEKTQEELTQIMKTLKIENYRIHTPTPSGQNVNYGIWLEIHKVSGEIESQ